MEEFDDAVEHGETHLFLRLTPSPALPPLPKFTPPASPTFPPSSALPTTPSADSSFNNQSKEDHDTPRRASVADFASLDLSPEELAELVREIEAGDTFDSAIVLSSSPILGSGTISPLPAVVEEEERKEKLTVVEVVGAGPERSINQDASYDEFDGIDITEAESEQILRELDGGMDDISLESPTMSRAPRPTTPLPLGVAEKEEGEGGVVEQILSPKALTADKFDSDRRSIDGEGDMMQEVDIGEELSAVVESDEGRKAGMENGDGAVKHSESKASEVVEAGIGSSADQSTEMDDDRAEAHSPFDLIPDSPNLTELPSSSSHSSTPLKSTATPSAPSISTSTTTKNGLDNLTSIENGDGAALSAPASQVSALHLTRTDVAQLEAESTEGVLEIDPLVEDEVEHEEFVDMPDSTSGDAEEIIDESVDQKEVEEVPTTTKLSKKAAKRANQKAKKVASEQEAVEELKADLNGGRLDADEKEVPKLEDVSF